MSRDFSLVAQPERKSVFKLAPNRLWESLFHNSSSAKLEVWLGYGPPQNISKLLKHSLTHTHLYRCFDVFAEWRTISLRNRCDSLLCLFFFAKPTNGSGEINKWRGSFIANENNEKTWNRNFWSVAQFAMVRIWRKRFCRFHCVWAKQINTKWRKKVESLQYLLLLCSLCAPGIYILFSAEAMRNYSNRLAKSFIVKK